MSIKLPDMRLLCFRWCLPAPIAEACDYYFIDRPSFPDLANSLQIMKDGKVSINRHGVDFEVVFQNEAEVLYTDCMKKELAGDPCVQVTFWCSFRSITFEWAGVKQTRSVVLVQPAKVKARSKETGRHKSKLRRHAENYKACTINADYLGDIRNLPLTEKEASSMVSLYRNSFKISNPTFAACIASAIEDNEDDEENNDE